MHSALYDTSHWILQYQQYGYVVMFLALLIEGPVITAAGAFLAALNYFNIWIVFVLSILGNLVPDVVYYALGFWGGRKLIEKYGHFFRISKEKIVALEKLARNHAWKALILIKLIPLLATPGLIAVGSARMNLKKYIWICLVITVPSSLFFLILGYYFGSFYDRVTSYINYGQYTLVGIIAFFFLISFGWKKFAERIAKNVEKEK